MNSSTRKEQLQVAINYYNLVAKQYPQYKDFYLEKVHSLNYDLFRETLKGN